MTHEAGTAGTVNSSNRQDFHTPHPRDRLLSKDVPCLGPSSPRKSRQEEVIIIFAVQSGDVRWK